jgi:GNAT superfamily N-acetyltransferase
MMIKFEKALESDAIELTGVAIRAFGDDKVKYGSYPPGIDTVKQHITFMKIADYFKIIKDNIIIGGMIVFHDRAGNYTLGSIFLEPAAQNHGIGKQAIDFLERFFPSAKKWSLDTPYLNFRNHHFYEKMGYKKVGEMLPHKNNDFCLFLYEKKMGNSVWSGV